MVSTGTVARPVPRPGAQREPGGPRNGWQLAEAIAPSRQAGSRGTSQPCPTWTPGLLGPPHRKPRRTSPSTARETLATVSSGVSLGGGAGRYFFKWFFFFLLHMVAQMGP